MLAEADCGANLFPLPMPRVAIILSGFSADEHDPCIPVIRNFVGHLAGHAEVVVYALHYPFRRGSWRAAGATVVGLSNRKLHGPARLMLWQRLRRHIAAAHAARPFQLLHAFWATEPGFLASRIAQQFGIPSVVSVAGGEFAALSQFGYGAQRTRRGRWIVADTLRRATAVTAGSRWVAELAPPHHRRRILPMPLGVELGAFAPASLRTGKRVLIASSMIPLKDYPTMLRAVAIARVRLPELQLEVAGTGTEMERVRRMAFDAGLADSTHFLGFVPNDEMPRIFQRCDLLLHGSHYEAQGMVVLEALATGMPVVATSVGIAAELPPNLVRHVHSGNAEQMAAALVESFSSDAHAAQALHAGPELVRQQFSVGKVGADFLNLYKEVSRVE
ncbi:MAG: glycosyltransferase family 1 protein [Chlorobi bacterium CHB2]|nr:glycosyltransferase family 1 protein [Chlorobi bacterium CHB2]